MHCMRRSSSSSRQHQQRHSRAGLSLRPCMEAGRQNDAEESESLAVPTAKAGMHAELAVTRSMPNLLASRSMYILLVCRSICMLMCTSAAAACPCPARRRREIGHEEKRSTQGTTLSTLLQCDLNVLSLPITFQALSTRQHSGWGPPWQALALAHTDQITTPLCLQDYSLRPTNNCTFFTSTLFV
jgi:hypothetical protein